MLGRRGFLGLGAASAAVFNAGAATSQSSFAKTYSYDGRMLRVASSGVRGKLRAFVIGDTHFALRDSRDDAYADYYKRMGQWNASKEQFAKFLRRRILQAFSRDTSIVCNSPMPTDKTVSAFRPAATAITLKLKSVNSRLVIGGCLFGRKQKPFFPKLERIVSEVNYR